MGLKERRKGAAGEREVVALLRSHGLPCDRTARQSGVVVRGDLTGVPGYHFEVKRQETARVWAWIQQAETEAKPPELDDYLGRQFPVPVVAFRRNASPWYAILPLHDLAKLLDLARLTA